MRALIELFLILSLLVCSSAEAQTDLSGIWQGKMEVDQSQKLTIHFIITKLADGSYKVVLNSPDTGAIKDVPASAVSFKDGKLNLEVESLSGSYSGVVVKNTITGEWSQPGGAFPLVLTPYTKPDQASTKPLLGEWVGKLKVTEDLSYNIVFRYETTKNGKYAAFLDSPDQGAKGIPVTDVLLEGKQVSFKVPAIQGEYAGEFSGKSITGSWKQPGFEGALDLAKGKFQAPVAKIEISAEDMKELLGKWVGKVGPLTLVVRFEQNAAGKNAIFIDSPDQGASGIPVSEAALVDDTLSLTVAAVGGKYSGKLSGNKIDGAWTQLGKDTPLLLTKE